MTNPRFSKRIRFRPWIGKKYWKGGPQGRRLLIIGESHYSGQDDAVKWDRRNRDLTSEHIAKQGKPGSYSYYTKLACAVTGEAAWEVDKPRFWPTVAFYEYVQDIVGVGARVPPTEAQWNEALELLPEVLGKLRPQFVLATGRRLWDELPETWPQDRKIRFEGEPWETCVGHCGRGQAFRATYITHPSGRTSGSGLRWHPLVRKFLALPLATRTKV